MYARYGRWRKPAFLTLSFEPGECARVDRGEYGTVNVGNTRRKLSFFVMVLCYSRRQCTWNLPCPGRLPRFLALSPAAERYYQELQQRRLNPRHHPFAKSSPLAKSTGPIRSPGPLTMP